MATIHELRDKSLKKLRVLEEGETPTNEVIADVEAAYEEIHAYLSTQSAIGWDSDEDIPDEAVRPMVTVLAAEMADDFGVEEPRYQRLQMQAYGPDGDKNNITGGALATLIGLASGSYITTTIEADYF